MELDLSIKNGIVVDGTGRPGFWGSIGITGDSIAFVSDDKETKKDEPPARETYDARGAVISPGFIDIHSHADMAVLLLPQAENYLRQGVSTLVTGNCGLSMAPCNDEHLEELQAYMASFVPSEMKDIWNWKSFADFLDRVDSVCPAANILPLAGHGAIRIACEGFERTPARGERLEAMERLLVQCLQAGAWGMSTGLVYPPGSYSDEAELASFFETLGRYGALYTTHLRSEGEFLEECVDEAIRLAERYGTRVEFSHHKSVPAISCRGKVKMTLAAMREARARGLDVQCDVYPYSASCTTITALLPSSALEGGMERFFEAISDPEKAPGLIDQALSDNNAEETLLRDLPWDIVTVISCPKMPACEGKTLDEIVPRTALRERLKLLLDWMLAVRGTGMMVLRTMDRNDVDTVVLDPDSIIASDSWLADPLSPEKCHPRSFGTFPHFIHNYVNVKRAISLENAVKKVTSMPAHRMGLRDRGVLSAGNKADILIFEPDGIGNLPTFDDPKRCPDGIRHLWINGKHAVRDGRLCPARNGRVLRKTYSV
jgi:N-acyl-D-aspartate/D-glutamate deacylase